VIENALAKLPVDFICTSGTCTEAVSWRRRSTCTSMGHAERTYGSIDRMLAESNLSDGTKAVAGGSSASSPSRGERASPSLDEVFPRSRRRRRDVDIVGAPRRSIGSARRGRFPCPWQGFVRAQHARCRYLLLRSSMLAGVPT